VTAAVPGTVATVPPLMETLLKVPPMASLASQVSFHGPLATSPVSPRSTPWNALVVSN